LIRSFQMKLALLSTFVSGVVLVAFGLVFWHVSVDLHQQRLDRDIVSLAYRLLASGSHSLADLEIDAEQVIVYGEELGGVASLLTDSHQNILHRTDNWPGKILDQSLPTATELEKTNLPVHDHDGHGRTTHQDAAGRNAHAEDIPVEPHFNTVTHEGKQWRLVGLRNAGNTLHVAVNLAAFQANVHHLRSVLVLSICGALFVLALGAWWVARRAMRPVSRLTEMAGGITAAELGQRIVDRGANLEFARLIRVFNEMLARLEASFQQAVRFSADASHELKTPLTVMQGEMETALQQAPAGSEAQQAFASQLEEIQRLNSMVGKLLLLSQADSGALQPARDSFDISEMVRRVCEDIPALDADLTVDCQVGSAIEFVGDQDLLRQVVQNLVVNAVRYNRPGGWVRCEVNLDAEAVVLRVGNSGAPIPPEHHEEIFRRFYRLDKSRTGDHVGLGLSLAREIARVHGGRLELVSSDESGTVLELRLPTSTL
jgi:two-component system heavy metal sensor histidine kinase CusS